MPFWPPHVKNVFKNILWNLHISDPDETNPLKGEANHDPLFLVRLMVDMMQRNFHRSTSQERNFLCMKAHVLLRAGSISSDLTQKKPNRFHIKCYMSVNLALAALYVAYHKIALDLIEHTGCKRINDICG